MDINVIPQETTILVVDDTPTNLQVLFQLLDQEGYRVASARDGAAALERVQAFTPDLILLDVMMPEIDGFEACCQLKTNPATQNIPIIFMTALSDPIDRVQGLGLGAVDYITKPIQHEEALARIQVHLKLRRLTQTLEQQVAGRAHVLEAPVSAMHNHIAQTEHYMQTLVAMLQLYQQEYPEPSPAIAAKAQDLELDAVIETTPQVISSMYQGIDRIKQLVLENLGPLT